MYCIVIWNIALGCTTYLSEAPDLASAKEDAEDLKSTVSDEIWTIEYIPEEELVLLLQE